MNPDVGHPERVVLFPATAVATPPTPPDPAPPAVPPGTADGGRITGRWDLVGGILATLLVVWTVWVSQVSGGDPVPTVAWIAAAVAIYAVVRAASAASTTWTTATLLLAMVAVAALPQVGVRLGAIPSGLPFPPLGYANASGAFFLVGLHTAVLWALATRSTAIRVLAIVMAAGTFALVVASGSEAALGLAFLLPPAVLLARMGRVRALLITLAIALVASVGLTVLLGAVYDPGPTGDTGQEIASLALTERRLELWRDAVEITADHPLSGVGVGGFVGHSPVARADIDAFTPHSAYLRAGSELGLPGALLILGIAVWLLLRLQVGLGPAGRGSALAAVAGAAVAAVALHASIDYVLEAPAVLLAVAASAAIGTPVGSLRDT